MPHARSVSVALFVGVGSRHETDVEAGLSHMVEHLAFKGTRGYPEPGALSEAIEPNDNLELTIRHIVIAFLGFAQNNYLLSRYLWLARHSEFLSGKILQPTVVGFDHLGRRLTRSIKKGIRLGEIPEEAIRDCIEAR